MRLCLRHRTFDWRAREGGRDGRVLFPMFARYRGEKRKSRPGRVTLSTQTFIHHLARIDVRPRQTASPAQHAGTHTHPSASLLERTGGITRQGETNSIKSPTNACA